MNAVPPRRVDAGSPPSVWRPQPAARPSTRLSMVDRHFGFSASPFGLTPDPRFYFESEGHGRALAYLKYGVHQGEGFVVITGDVGAGKTTLVQTLLSDAELPPVLAAQVLSTQLEADELLRAVAMAFHLPLENHGKAALLNAMGKFLAAQAGREQRVLLVVDEAQNLSPAAVEELRMLSNFQVGHRAAMQSFLVGQPQLRGLLASPDLEQFRQRVIASCHLGPIAPSEVEAYVLHRLRKVGWTERPRLHPDVFAHIHGWTDGIPRRVNLLCTRLLLWCFLSGAEEIQPADADTVAREMNAELSPLQSMAGGA